MDPLPESIQFYLDTCDRLSLRECQEGIEKLSPVEQTIFHAYRFDCEEQNGGLSQFFYNTDSSREIAEATARSLETIGAPETARILRRAAAVICRGAEGYVGTWGGYLAQIDPEGALGDCGDELGTAGESLASLLEEFVLQHREELATEQVCTNGRTGFDE